MLKIIWDWVKKRVSSLWEKIGKDLLLSFLIGTFVLLSALVLAVMSSESVEGCVSQLLGVQDTEGVSKKYGVLKALVIVMGGVVLVMQAWIANKRAKAMENAANEQAKANRNTEQGQRQERLKNAIEHLGHDNASVRLGGAYELFHLAEDTTDWRQTVLDILCSHIRRTTGEGEYRRKYESKPSEEIQSLLTLLFVQEHEVFKGLHINLQGSWLDMANLSGARLENAFMVGAWLEGVDLSKSSLQRADLSDTHLQMANLRKANLQGAELSWTRLQGARLGEAQLQGTNLVMAGLQRADLSLARLQGANLLRVKMQGADLSGARLQGANLYAAEMQGVSLCAAEMQGTVLYGTKMQGIISSGSDGFLPPFEELMKNRVGGGSDLNGIIFEGELSQEDLDSFTECLPDKKAKELREKLKPHIGKLAIRELPESSRAITGAYTAEEAEQWIAEYNEAISEVPGNNN